ncbi:NAD(P)-binding domain,Short-chain dehydrogenase/reductase SDR [Cinara cedri]|uniref:NAD(P)-binding domain,Short-chain dehydrogenase/reductase SDR n=1 Tax=Cinara cedri TaxID=506608 RepID=A0A5E4MTC5_9HEMI|nr:NAD(P)-binding domain,Short-chain dehydrogenase/reductase SDR [Cinara cedri]
MVNIPKPLIYVSVFGTICGSTYLIKDFISGKNYKIKTSAADKVIIITGANTGLGKEAARLLAIKNATVVMACRDLQSCEKSRVELALISRNKRLYCRECDLASQESIRQFATNFQKEFKRLDVLINNAGVMRCPKSVTREGIETHLGVNHMGHFLLTNLLLNCLKQSAPSRIVNVTMLKHQSSKINKEDLNSSISYNDEEAFNQSKLANLMFTSKLAEILKDTGVTVNAIYPGICTTNIVRHLPFYNSFTRFFIKPMAWLVLKSPAKGSQTLVHAALDPELENVTGKFISNFKIIPMPHQVRNQKDVEWLWKVSEKWTKVKETSPEI